jgi:hypothetical protein
MSTVRLTLETTIATALSAASPAGHGQRRPMDLAGIPHR